MYTAFDSTVFLARQLLEVLEGIHSMPVTILTSDQRVLRVQSFVDGLVSINHKLACMSWIAFPGSYGVASALNSIVRDGINAGDTPENIESVFLEIERRYPADLQVAQARVILNTYRSLKMVLSGLTEGRIVHFVLESGEHRAAIVVRVWRDTPEHRESGCVNLRIFTDGENDIQESDDGWKQLVKFSPTHEPGTFHWIEPA